MEVFWNYSLSDCTYILSFLKGTNYFHINNIQYINTQKINQKKN